MVRWSVIFNRSENTNAVASFVAGTTSLKSTHSKLDSVAKKEFAKAKNLGSDTAKRLARKALSRRNAIAQN